MVEPAPNILPLLDHCPMVHPAAGGHRFRQGNVDLGELLRMVGDEARGEGADRNPSQQVADDGGEPQSIS
jgi:hypothetical protein